MGFLSRLPNSNDPSNSSNNPCGLEDEIGALLTGIAERCSNCRHAFLKHYLHDGLCPDCYKKKNGVEPPLKASELPKKRRIFICCDGADID